MLHQPSLESCGAFVAVAIVSERLRTKNISKSSSDKIELRAQGDEMIRESPPLNGKLWRKSSSEGHAWKWLMILLKLIEFDGFLSHPCVCGRPSFAVVFSKVGLHLPHLSNLQCFKCMLYISGSSVKTVTLGCTGSIDWTGCHVFYSL